jgi:transposase
MPILAHPDAVFVGLNVHKGSISAAILNPDLATPDVEKIFHEEESVRRLVGRLGDPSLLWACYEAGPTGYNLLRLLSALGVHCSVVAP